MSNLLLEESPLFGNLISAVVRESAAVESYRSDATKEPPFGIAQIVVLALFVVLTIRAVKKFRIESMSVAKSSAKRA